MQCIHTDYAPRAIGPYSQGMEVGDLFFFSGQIPLDPQTMALVEGEFEDQVCQVLRNLEALLEAISVSKNHLVKVTVFLTDLSYFKVFNDLYAQWLGDHKPARSCIEVSALPLGAQVEVEMIVKRPS